MKWDLTKLDDDGLAKAVSALRFGHTLCWFGGAFLFGSFAYNFVKMERLLTTIDGDDFGMRGATMLLLTKLTTVGYLIAFAVMAVGANILKAQLLMLRNPAK